MIYPQRELLTSVIGNTFPTNSSFFKSSIYVISIGIIYYLLVKACTTFFLIPSINMSVFWPINAIYAAFLLMSPRFLWKYIILVVFIANGLGNFNSGQSTSLSLGFAIANTVEGGLIAYFSFKWNKPNVALASFRNLFLFIFIVIFSTFIGAIFGAFNLSYSYGWSRFWDFFLAWFTADTLGSILMFTVIFAWNDKLISFKKIKLDQFIGGVALVISSIAISIMIYSQKGETEIVPLNYMVFPLLIWAAFQFKVKGASIVVLLIAFISHWYTLHGQGAFMTYGISIQDHIFWLQCYLAIVFMTATSLALAISERNNTSESLKINKMLVDEVPKAVVVCRLDNHEDKNSFRIVAANKSAAKLAHSDVDSLLGLCLTDSFFGQLTSDSLSDYQEWVLASQGEAELPELIIETEEGTGAKIYRCDSMYVGESCIGIFYEDITESKKVEELHRQSAKLEALGTLAGGIAHEFNNVIGLVLGYTEMGVMSSRPESKEEGYFKKIASAGERASFLVKKILAFSRMDKIELHPINLREAVESALEMVSPAINANIEIRHNIYPNNHLVLADEVDVHQIILNLCINASHAFQGENGRIQITLHRQLVDGKQLNSLDLIDKKYLKLEVTDTGQGISEEIIKKIFDPFFTTKEVGEGTGLGLSMVYGAMKQYGGNITVESKIGRGTTFSLFFPIESEQANDISSDTFIEYPSDTFIENPITSEITGHVLIVDDEPLLLNLYRKFLEAEGFTVTTCGDGKEALELFIQYPNKFDVVFTDNEMPKITGKQLCQTLLSINKHQSILLATGYSANNLEKDIIALGCKGFFLKPVTLRRLEQTISELLVKQGDF